VRDKDAVQNALMKWPVTDLRGLARHVLCAPRCYVRRIVNAVTALTKRLSCGLISKP